MSELLTKRAPHAFSAPAPVREGQRNVILYMQGSTRFSPSWQFEELTDSQTGAKNTVLRVKGMPVFRSGSFKDSMGDLTTWESLHIEQMVSSFNFLRENQVFADVPVREGHGSFFGDPMTGLVGYHDALSTQSAIADDGNTYQYLFADFTIFDQQHQNDFLSGKWRNRSSEVGYYESNDGTGYYPVYQGFAFVDIPAVQYLNQFGKEKQKSFSVLMERDIEVSQPNPTATPPEGTVNPDGSAAPGSTPPEGEGEVTDPATGENGNTAPEGTPPPAVTPPEPTPVPPADANAQQHSAGNAPQSFSCGGNQVSDFAAVQSYITGLEAEANGLREFQRETMTAGRRNFVSQLASDNKITAAQVEGMTEHALSLPDNLYASWKAMYDNAPALPLFERHVGGEGNTPENVDGLTQDERDFKLAQQQVSWHRMGGVMGEDQIKQTVSYKRMVELGTKLGKEVD